MFALLLITGCASHAGAPDSSAVGTVASAEAPTIVTQPATVATRTPGTATPALDGASITISAVGDISLARQVVDRMQANGADYPYALVAPLVDGDIGLANLEGPFTDRGDPWPKGYNFRTPARFAAGLRSGRFGVVTLANNHTLDFGAIGLTDTIAALDAAGIGHAGAGRDDIAAWNPVIIDVRGLRTAFIGCALTPDEGGGFSIRAWAAGSGDAPGIAVCEAGRLRDAVARARTAADFVIVAVHAGDEYNTAPNATQRELATAALEGGADAYIGAHAHVVQPIERHGQQLVVWGLGNFIFDLDEVDLANIPQPRVSLILDLTLTKGRGVTAYHAIPVTQDADEDRPRPAAPEEAAALYALIGE